jgi:hypothetical protein
MTREDRFWKKVIKQPSGCWEHQGSIGSHGYPQAQPSGLAHRESWKMHNGEIQSGMMVLHNCNNKRCVNPEHLRLGTHKENMDDVCKVGHPRRKLSDDDILEIRKSTEPLRARARRFGVSQKAIQNITRGITYRHVKEI